MSILVEFDDFVDQAISGGALEVFDALSGPSAVFLTLLAGGALTWWGVLSALRGSFSFEGFLSFAWRFFLFYSLVSGSFLWVDIVYPILKDFGPGVGNVIIKTFSGEENPGGVIVGLTSFISIAFEGIQEGLNGLSFGSFFTGKGLMSVFVSFITMVLVVLMALIALTLIVISKVIMAILIGITPVLAVWAFIKNTADVFNGWMRGVTLLIVLQILIYGVLGTLLAASTNLVADASTGLSIADQINTNLAVFLILSGVGFKCLLVTPMIAYTVGGAVMNLGSNFVGNTLKSALSPNAEPGRSQPSNSSDASKARSQAASEASNDTSAPVGNDGLSAKEHKRIQDVLKRHEQFDKEQSGR